MYPPPIGQHFGRPLGGQISAEAKHRALNTFGPPRPSSLTPYTSAACFSPYGLWSLGQRKLWVALKQDGFGFSRLRV